MSPKAHGLRLLPQRTVMNLRSIRSCRHKEPLLSLALREDHEVIGRQVHQVRLGRREHTPPVETVGGRCLAPLSVIVLRRRLQHRLVGMNMRFYIVPETHEPHLQRHGVGEGEAEDVLRHPHEDRPGRDGARVAIGQTRSGRYPRVVYVPDPEPDSVFCITALDLGPKALHALRRRRRKKP